MTALEAELTRQLAESQQALAAALRENQLLRQKVDLLVRRVFGSSSEKLDAAQLQLLLLSEAPAVAEPLPIAPSQTPRAPRTRPPRCRDCLTTCRRSRKSLIPLRPGVHDLAFCDAD